MTLAFGDLRRSVDGSVDGSGYGSGGYGYGSVDGSVDGYVDGSVDGSGYGSGGYGYGSVDGYGYVSGYGSVDGSGDGYWIALLPRPDEAFWWSDADGMPSNGGRHNGFEPAAPGVIHEEAGPLNICSSGTLHATRRPQKWKGERLWRVRLHGEVIGDDEKLGCLKREIIEQAIPPPEAKK